MLGEYLAYDSDRKKFAFAAGNGLGRYFLGGEKQMDEGLKLLEEQKKDKPKRRSSPRGSTMWRRASSNGLPDDQLDGRQRRLASPSFTISPPRSNSSPWVPTPWRIFDPAKNLWADAKPKGQSPKGYDCRAATTPNGTAIYRDNGDGERERG